MPQIFPESANWASKASILAGLLLAASILGVLLNINRIHYVNRVNIPLDQPVPFSHKHHVTGLGIDCRYCHTSVEKSAFAGIPPTETCMTCHSQIWTEAPNLEPVRASWRDNKPLEWNRVHGILSCREGMPKHVWSPLACPASGAPMIPVWISRRT